METPVDVPEKSLEKKVRAKAKPSLGGKVAGSSTPKETEATEEPSGKVEWEGMKENVDEGLQPGATAILSISCEGTETEKEDVKIYADEELEDADIEVKQESVTAKKNEPEANPEVNNETEGYTYVKDGPYISLGVNDESDGKIEKDAFENQQMDELTELGSLKETGEEFPSVEAGEGEVDGEGMEGAGDQEEGSKLEEEEQIQISDMAKARKIKKELEIFVGGLDRDAVEDDLRKAFEKVGDVVEVRLHKDYATNKNKGFAFVKFANKEQVARALEQMKNPLVRFAQMFS